MGFRKNMFRAHLHNKTPHVTLMYIFYPTRICRLERRLSTHDFCQSEATHNTKHNAQHNERLSDSNDSGHTQ